MGFVDEVKEVVANFLKNFAASYQAAFTAAIVNDIIKQKEIEAKEAAGEPIGDADPRQLLHKEPKPTELSGKIGKGDGKKFKDHFAVIKPDWTIEIYKKEGDEEPIDVLNVWKYDVKKHAADPGAKKRMGGPAWIDDSERSECTGCQAGFSLLKRRHHCRACGEIFCAACTSNSYMLPSMGYADEQRVCTPCYEKIKADGVAALEYEEPSIEGEGSFAVKLVHSTRFPHFFSFESEEERDDWMKALENLSDNSPPPINRNPQMAHAFKEAYTAAVRGDGRWWWSWRVEGSEQEMLATLLNYILERDVLPGALSDISTSIPYSMRRKAAKKLASQMEGTVNSMVSDAWASMAAEVAKSEPTLREKIEPQAIPVGEAQQNIRAQIQEKTEAALNAALDKAAKPILEKVLEVMLDPVENAHIAMFSAVRQCTDNVIEECRKSSHREREFASQLDRQKNKIGYSNDVFKPVYDALYANGEQLGMLKKVPGLDNLNPRSILYSFMDELRRLARDGLYTFSQDEDVIAAVGGDGSDADVEAAMEAGYSRMSVKLLHDSQKVIFESFMTVLVGLIQPPIENDVVGSDVVQGAVGPLESSIPDPLKQFVSVNDELNNAVSTGVENSISEFLQPRKEGTNARVAEAWAQERGNQA